MAIEEIQATAFPYSVKIEQTAKGARVSVHAYSTVADTAVNEATATYKNVREKLIKEGFKVAPEE